MNDRKNLARNIPGLSQDIYFILDCFDEYTLPYNTDTHTNSPKKHRHHKNDCKKLMRNIPLLSQNQNWNPLKPVGSQFQFNQQGLDYKFVYNSKSIFCAIG
jgi:hypothetical protein